MAELGIASFGEWKKNKWPSLTTPCLRCHCCFLLIFAHGPERVGYEKCRVRPSLEAGSSSNLSRLMRL